MPFSAIKQDIKNSVHFVGIGGIGMSSIAKILIELGVKVTGSDLKSNKIIENLLNQGAKINFPHNQDNIDKKADYIVTSSAIKDNNPEILRARNLNIPIIKRADFLNKILKLGYGITVAGTHGKTSTTAMIANLFEEANLNPTVINGGIINDYNCNAKIGDGKYIIAESDESDGSFVNLATNIGVITNIEEEHMEFYDNYQNLESYFTNYIIGCKNMIATCVDDQNFRTRQ